MKHLDLFSGIGGFALAAKWAGFETIQFVEKDPFCQKVLKKHWPNVLIHSDIKDFTFTDKVDLLTGGFPCQPFSVAGKKKGINDDRYLWPEMLRIISECRPSYIVIENVPGIVRNGLERIVGDLEGESYLIQNLVIPACSIFAPHKRERIYIIANRDGKRCHLWCDTRKDGQLQDNQEWNLSQVQQEWSQLIPISWKINKAEDWFQFNSEIVRRNDGVSGKLDKDRVKALGNAIVPQVVYPILKLIYELNK
jgi:DNA (cytosine-5)-methyltransferase 1